MGSRLLVYDHFNIISMIIVLIVFSMKQNLKLVTAGKVFVINSDRRINCQIIQNLSLIIIRRKNCNCQWNVH